MADETPSSSWTAAIPELFYDVLARILPGFVTLASGFYVYGCWRTSIDAWPIDWEAIAKDTTLWVAFAVTMSSWVLGLLLTPLGESLWARQRKPQFLNVVARHPVQLQQACDAGILTPALPEGVALDQINANTENGEKLAGEVYQQLHEYLKDRKPEWRSVLSKSQAEVTFYANVTAGFMVVLVFGSILSTIWLLVARLFAWKEVAASQIAWFGVLSILPMVVLGECAYWGLYGKVPRLWARHMGMLSTELKSAKDKAVKQERTFP